MKRIRLDLNFASFQDQLFALEIVQLKAVIKTFAKIRKLTWDDLYRDNGLNWEFISSQTSPSGGKVYSFRVSKKFRALACRDGDFLVLISLHPDHDSAY